MNSTLKISDIKYYSIAILTGSFSLFPFAIFFKVNFKLSLHTINEFYLVFYFVFLVLSILVGLIFLELAMLFEGIFDKKLSTKKINYFLDIKEEPIHNSNWYLYLFKTNKIHEVIDYIVFRLKFQLTSIFSLILFNVGILILKYYKINLSVFIIELSIFLSIIFVLFLFKRAWNNCKNLSFLRFSYNQYLEENNL
jgi:hypothetical protein